MLRLIRVSGATFAARDHVAESWCTEIDVSATPGEELPQASSCQC